MAKYKDIIDIAFKTCENAYAPYSKYKVGACVLTKDGKHFIGANVENASYGLTNCAERNAIFQTYSNGYRKNDIEAIAIVSNGKTLATPCGACRQVLVELLEENTPIVLSNHKIEKITNIGELLPMSFTEKDL
ncbi:cytidine deaminase [Clostridium sp. CT7]|uniref:cytidine deaminase n=1 Tax=Clostridium sp. CT7 TaxID=2052574 RepID=UPI00082401CE|nr:MULTISPECIES: cytidine deaminase [Clostridium]PJI10321.1 cytidine deaminase [Clostridium sp. CT7]